MSVITISGNIGSGATEIGRLVAAKLGLDYVDNRILTEAARTLGVSLRTVEHHDDRSPPPTLRERLATFFQDFLERSAVAGVADPLMGTASLETLMATTYREAAALPEVGHEFSESRYKEVLTSIISDLGAKGDVVIIGRGGQAILKGRPGCLHVCATAPFDVRVRCIAERDRVPEAQARELVEESDKGRMDYHHKYFRVNPTDPNLYDLVLNTAHLSHESAAELIVAALRFKMPASA